MTLVPTNYNLWVGIQAQTKAELKVLKMGAKKWKSLKIESVLRPKWYPKNEWKPTFQLVRRRR